MDYLWKTEADDDSDLESNQDEKDITYCDFFDFLDDPRGLVIGLGRPWPISNSIGPLKNNGMSTNLRKNGNEKFEKRLWLEAMRDYNESLLFAENGTENVCFAYSNRSNCFFHLKQFDKCLQDIEMAKKTGYPNTEKLDKRKIRCLKEMQQQRQEDTQHEPEHKLCFQADQNFPSMTDVMKIQRNSNFGRHFVATRDIPVGKTIFAEKSFLSGSQCTCCNSPQHCLTCQKTKMNFIACENCTNALFCDEKCKKQNNSHKYDCNYVYNEMCSINADLKMLAKSIYFGIDAFESVDELIAFVEKVRRHEENWIPESTIDAKSVYGLFLSQLKYKNENDIDNYIMVCHCFYKTIMAVPLIKNLFDTVKKQRFLMHLVIMHVLIVRQHMKFTTHFFQLFSFFKHACVPNVLHFLVGDRKVCITTRPVKRGEPLLIASRCAYLPDVELRGWQHIKDYGFLCRCEKCKLQVSPRSSSDVDRMKADQDYRFLQRNCYAFMEILKIGSIRQDIKKKCIDVLNKYGHTWSEDLQFVMDIYERCETYEHRSLENVNFLLEEMHI